MSQRAAGDMRMIALKLASGDSTSTAVTILVSGSAGVNLGCIGRTLGLEPSTVRLNGHFISRGADLVSSLPWNSLVSFFVARGLPAGGSLLDSIVVQGKLIANTGFKRKATIKDEKPHKKNRLLECCSMEQNIDTGQLADGECLCIKRHLKLVADHPSKKGKIDECSSDCHSSSDMNNGSHLSFKGKGIVDDEKIPRKNQFFKGSTIDQNSGTEKVADDTDFLCINRRLKLDDDHPTKKGKIGECNSGFSNEASKISIVSSTETGLNCSFMNVFGKRSREDNTSPSVFCKRIK